MKYAMTFLLFALGFVGVELIIIGIDSLPDDAFQRECLDPFVSVETPNGLGSGVVIYSKPGMRTRVLTAAHVVRKRWQKVSHGPFNPINFNRTVDADKVKVIGHAYGLRKEYEVDFIESPDWKNDLAVIWLKADDLPKIHGVCSAGIQVGDECWYVGNPNGLRKLTEKSIISALRFDEEELTVTGGMGWYGNSGGPLFVKRKGHYYLAGICICSWSDYPKTPVGFANPEKVAKICGGF